MFPIDFIYKDDSLGITMEKIKELELDIQYVKSVVNRYAGLYKDTLSSVAKTNKIINSRRKFILFQFRNIFDFRFWF